MTSGDDAPKYVNSPETKIFHKSNILYNYHIAKQSAKHDGYLYVLEGFMDVFAFDSIGITSAVALMCTKLTENHIAMIKRLNVEVRLCLDGDKAGQEAMMGIMASLDKAGIHYRLVSQPGEFRDPDEILKQDGEDKLKVYVNTLVDPFNFPLNYYRNYSPLGSMEDKKKVVAHFAPMLANMKSKLEFEDYLYKLAEITNINVNAIRDYVEDVRRAKPKDERVSLDRDDEFERVNTLKELSRLARAERLMLAYMLNSKEAVKYYEDKIGYFTNNINRQLAHYVVEYNSQYQEINPSMIMDMISSNDEESDKKELISLLADVSNDEYSNENEKQILDDCYKVIVDEKNKMFNRTTIEKALEGKDPKEQARLLNDYIKRTNKRGN
jgi:DNA primase